MIIEFEKQQITVEIQLIHIEGVTSQSIMIIGFKNFDNLVCLIRDSNIIFIFEPTFQCLAFYEY